MNNKTLTRSSRNKILGGVCSGIAHYAGIEPWIVQLLCAILILSSPPLILLYFLLVIILPMDKEELPPAQFATGENPSAAADEPVSSAAPPADHSNQVVLGIVLVTLGVILLMHYLFPYLSFQKLWPVVLIILGSYMIWQSFREPGEDSAEDNSMDGEDKPSGQTDTLTDLSKTEDNEN